MRVALAYSGRLEESAAIRWLTEERQVEVVTVTPDFGQGRRLEGIRDRALALGARRAHVVDERERFAERFVLPALKAGVLQGGAERIAALTDAATADRLIQVGIIEEVDAIAHAEESSSRFDWLLNHHVPAVPVMAVTEQWTLTPGDIEAFRASHGLESDASAAARLDLWEGARRDTADGRERSDLATLPDEAAVSVAFEQGEPVGLNGVSLPVYELITTLSTVSAPHRVGSLLALDAAHRSLVRATLSPEAGWFAATASTEYEGVIDRGEWSFPIRRALDAFFAVLQERATGIVRLSLHDGTYATIDTQLASSSSSTSTGSQ